MGAGESRSSRMLSRKVRTEVLMSAAARSASRLFICCITLVSSFAFAQDAPQNIENSKYQAAGVINANAVFVRSGASDNDYPVMKLDKGAQITVVGKRFDWLKIVPPDGSFCYVSK